MTVLLVKRDLSVERQVRVDSVVITRSIAVPGQLVVDVLSASATLIAVAVKACSIG